MPNCNQRKQNGARCEKAATTPEGTCHQHRKGLLPKLQGGDLMNPVVPRDGQVDVLLKGPPNSGIGDLPARAVSGGGFLSEWELSFNERQALMEGARVVLWVLASGHPPVLLEVEGVDYIGSPEEANV